MREITTTRTVYEFDELGERARDRARGWYRSCMDASDLDHVIEDAARMADLFGLDIRQRPVKLMGGGTRMEPDVYWDLGRDGGASYSGRYRYRKGSVRAVAKEAPAEWEGKVQEGNAELNRIVRGLAEVQRRNFYAIEASISHGRSPYNNLGIHAERNDRVGIISAEDAEEVCELLQDFANWIHRQLQREEEYQNSDEAVDENIKANEYEFDEEGNRA